MIRRVVDLGLVVLILVGGYLAWRSSRERQGLQDEYDRLVQAVGELPVTDPTKIYIRAIDTGDPMHFAWRVYLPPNYPYQVRDSRGGGMTSNVGTAQEFIARVRFRPDDQGRIECYNKFAGGANRRSLGTPEVGKLLQRRWKEIHVERLGSSEVAVLDPKKPATLFRLTLPPDLQSAVKGSSEGGPEEDPISFHLSFGPPGFVDPSPPPGGPPGER